MTTTPTQHPVRQGLAAGTSFGAAILLLTVGLLSLFQGIAAVAKDSVFVAGIAYTYKFTITTWGWIHIVLGILLILSAVGLLAGAEWARIVAIIIAALSILGNFLWLPYYPLWSILLIAIDVVVIWAVATWRPQT